ncbi:MAG: hypothetical protein MUF64_31770 [Polyangiaceae bacterium]|nr:hypothetical protein [Polyangiaceae bacterium]
MSHQAEQLADALVSEGLALREERASGFVWRAVARAEEPAAPASVLEDGDPPSAPRSRSKNGKSEEAAPELETASSFTPAPLAPSPAELLVEQACAECQRLSARVTELKEKAQEERDAFWKEALRCDDIRLQFCSALDLSAQAEWAMILGRVRDLRTECQRLRQERDMAQGEAHGLRQQLDEARAASDREPSADGDQLAQLLLDLPAEAFAAIAAARQDLTRARELLQRGRALEEQALSDLQAALTGKAPAPREAPQSQPEGRQAIATWARRPSSTETGEREGTARDRVMRLFLARPDERLTSAEVGHALEVGAKAVTGPLSTLTTDGKLERVTTGLYQLSKTWARRVA